MPSFDWNASTYNNAEQKKAFHAAAKRQLKKLADKLGFEKGSYDLRSNLAGPAVSGEVTLHHSDLYVQVSQGFGGSDTGILVRTCEHRKDYTGGRNHFASLQTLDDDKMARLVTFCGQILEQKRGFNADLKDDKGYNPYTSTPTRLGR